MKIFFLASLLFFSIVTFAQVGIGTTTPDGSAKLDVSSTTKGFLPPRLTTTQRNEINSPAVGLMIYNTTIGAIQFFTGSSWITANAALSDTSSLSNRIDAKLSKTDTASLSNRINAKLSKTDTASLSDRINAKLNSTVFPYYPGLQKGHIMYWNGSIWVNLNPGTAGQVLKMSSAAEPVPVWGTDATTSTTAFSPCGTTLSDIDGNSYNTVLIGTQCWTKENLRVRRYH